MLDFEIEGVKFVEKFYIMQNTSFDALLGNDFFHKHFGNIDYDTDKFTFKKDKIEARISTTMTQKTANQLCTMFSTNSLPLTSQVETIIPPKHEMLLNCVLPVAKRKEYQCKFGEIKSTENLFSTHGCITSNGFTYLKTKGRQNLLVMNTTSKPVRVQRGTVIAHYIPTTPYEYCHKGEGTHIDLTTLMSTKTLQSLNNMKSTQDIEVTEPTGSDIHTEDTKSQTTGTDYTTAGGFRDIQPAEQIKDFTKEEIEQLFQQEGLKDLLPNIKKSAMHVPGEPTDEQIQRLLQLLAKRREIFSKDVKKPTHVKHYSVSIPHFGEPTVEKIRPYTAIEVEQWKKHVQQLMESGTVEYSNSPWRSASFLVKKPSGGYRFVTDYRKANLQVPKMHWPLVRVDSALSALGNATIVSSCDANSAYHQIPLRSETDKQWTSFAGPTCQLQYTTLPQGYRNSVSEYSKFTSVILGELQWQCCLTYLDDFLIWSENFDQHIKDLDRVFCRLEYYGVQLSPAKSVFCQKQLPYLGHVIEPGIGIKPNPKLVQAIADIPPPTTRKQLSTFLQKVSFYRKMIPTYNKLVSPLQNLMNTSTWPRTGMNKDQTECFETIKKCLTTTPILTIPDLTPNSNPFYVITDACKDGVAGILMQKKEDNKLHPIMYASRVTEKHEKERYTTYQLEMAAIVWSMEVFKPYLRHKSIPFTLRTDCRSLCWLMKSEASYATKWIWKISEFDFKVEYIKGSHNPADLPSRMPLDVQQGYFSEIPIEPLYCEKHNTLMQYIIDNVNSRIKNKLKDNEINTSTEHDLHQQISSLNTFQSVESIVLELQKKMKQIDKSSKVIKRAIKLSCQNTTQKQLQHQQIKKILHKNLKKRT